MKIWTMAAAAGAALVLAGCISKSDSAPIASMPEDWSRSSRVETVTLDRDPAIEVSGEFDSIFQQRVRAKLDACATGARPLRMEARLQKLSKANPFVTAVLFGQNKVRGTARLVDVETGRVVGEYKIGQTITGSRLGVIAMAEAEEQLSDAFGAEVCTQAFGAPAEIFQTGQ